MLISCQVPNCNQAFCSTIVCRVTCTIEVLRRQNQSGTLIWTMKDLQSLESEPSISAPLCMIQEVSSDEHRILLSLKSALRGKNQ